MESVDVVQQNNLVKFVLAQGEINKVLRAFMERQSKKQDKAMALIQKLLEKKEDPLSNNRWEVITPNASGMFANVEGEAFLLARPASNSNSNKQT